MTPWTRRWQSQAVAYSDSKTAHDGLPYFRGSEKSEKHLRTTYFLRFSPVPYRLHQATVDPDGGQGVLHTLEALAFFTFLANIKKHRPRPDCASRRSEFLPVYFIGKERPGWLLVVAGTLDSLSRRRAWNSFTAP
jgi:hypothetical protein